jgi:hypothetical protein
MLHFRQALLFALFAVACIGGHSAMATSAAQPDYQKLGEYRYVYRMFFKLYDAELFTTKAASAKDVLNANAPFRLQFRYLRTIEKSIILQSADRMLERNLSEQDRAMIAQRVDRLNQAYTTVRDGDRSALSFQPGVGTTLSINGEPIVTIEGEDFARLYFQIWLGEQPISDRMKERLLGLDQAS